MSWTVIYSDRAQRDLKCIYDYIALVFWLPETAAKQNERIMDKIASLEEMPMRHRLYDAEPWHSRDLRFFPIDNFLVFYLTDKKEKTVSVVRIMYNGRDSRKELGE